VLTKATLLFHGAALQATLRLNATAGEQHE